MRPMRTVALGLMLIVVHAIVTATAGAAEPGGDPAAQHRTLLHGGLPRSYVVHVPRAAMERGARLPLVLVLHGGGHHAARAEEVSGFSNKADQEGFIVVYPEGTGRFRDKFLTWNAGHCCGYAMEKRVEDVGFIDALLDALIRDYPIDTARVYVTGMSNGGLMTHRLGIALGGRIADIAPVVAALFGDEPPPAQPVAALMVNGMLDRSVPPQGGHSAGRSAHAWDGTPAKPAGDQAAFWAKVNGCAAAPEERDQGAAIHWRYSCPRGQEVELYLVKDNGHAWPGGQRTSARGHKPTTGFQATDVIWAFFAAHAKSPVK